VGYFIALALERFKGRHVFIKKNSVYNPGEATNRAKTLH